MNPMALVMDQDADNWVGFITMTRWTQIPLQSGIFTLRQRRDYSAMPH
jgi:hypothetical protein